ncbi:MAG: cytochrome c [Gammaproteobacteria bacterium]|nr:cytochrome c [Gammaproteobacteria bacterium]
MRTLLLLTATAGLLLSGCSRDYTPAANATGEDIFKGACLECHEAIEGKEAIFYEITSADRNAEFFANKISSGSLIMPKFPNITGDSLKAVSQYAFEHSIDK